MYWEQSHSDCKNESSFKSLMQLNHVIEIHKPTQFPFTTVLQILEKKIAIPPFYQGTDNPFHLTFNCRTRNRSKPLTNIVLHTTGKTNGRHCHAETFAKKPSLRQPKPKHRFSAVSLPQYLLILPKYPLNPPRIPDNQASGPPFRQQQAHLAC